jgi:hypothetical protein
MDRPELCQHRDVAWLILGYLSRFPDSKDTIEGVQQWWLGSMQVGMDARKVQGALDDLVKAGWVISRECRASGAVYGLNEDRRQQLLQINIHGHETGSVGSRPSDE